MFAADILNELNFVIEFTLPKEISDNQDHIKLSVHCVDVPVVEIPICSIGHKPNPIRLSGEIHSIEYYKCVKDVLPLINRWVNSIYCTCSKLYSSRSNQFVEARLYAYRKDNSLFKKWDLEEFYPLFNPSNRYQDDVVELTFRFENIIDVDNRPMYDISKHIKEYTENIK